MNHCSTVGVASTDADRAQKDAEDTYVSQDRPRRGICSAGLHALHVTMDPEPGLAHFRHHDNTAPRCSPRTLNGMATSSLAKRDSVLDSAR